MDPKATLDSGGSRFSLAKAARGKMSARERRAQGFGSAEQRDLEKDDAGKCQNEPKRKTAAIST
jgi:hypothetical protein